MLILILFAFVAGIVTVLSPCILPVLPIVLSGSVGEGQRRPLGVVTGFVLSFTFFTLFLSSIVSAFQISPDALRVFSVVVIVGFGLSLLVPATQTFLERVFSQFSRFAPTGQHYGFAGGLVVGLSLGLIWTPCVGPILAAVISLALTGSVSGTALFITLAYALGTALPMLAIAKGGRELLQRVPWLLQNTAKIQKGFGVLMIVTGVGIGFGWDRQFQTWVLTTFPSYGTGLVQFEDNAFVRNSLDKLFTNDNTNTQEDTMGKPLFSLQDEMNYPEAPEITAGTNWVNSEPLSLEQLRGKVVLVDFWTYSCINCIRTLPYLTDWHANYADKGLVIVGVHAPEFEFEKSTDNVREAMADFGIEYPVVQDNDFQIWRAYNNRYWPAKYLIDKSGRIRYTHFGEGKYGETENKIRELLDEPLLTADQMPEEPRRNPFRKQTPETYLGFERAGSYVHTVEPNTTQTYSGYSQGAEAIPENGVALTGAWQLGPESVTAGAPAAVTTDDAAAGGATSVQPQLQLKFSGQHVYLVLSPGTQTSGTVRVLLDGQPIPAAFRTKDMDENGVITIDQARKYDLVDLDKAGDHLLQIEFSEGVAAFAFTFG